MSSNKQCSRYKRHTQCTWFFDRFRVQAMARADGDNSRLSERINVNSAMLLTMGKRYLDEVSTKSHTQISAASSQKLWSGVKAETDHG